MGGRTFFDPSYILRYQSFTICRPLFPVTRASLSFVCSTRGATEVDGRPLQRSDVVSLPLVSASGCLKDLTSSSSRVLSYDLSSSPCLCRGLYYASLSWSRLTTSRTRTLVGWGPVPSLVGLPTLLRLKLPVFFVLSKTRVVSLSFRSNRYPITYPVSPLRTESVPLIN